MLGSYLGIYEAQTKKESLKSHRGGGDVVTTLLVYGLESGIIDKALVVKMSSVKPWKAVATIARTSKEAIEAAGSKYTFVPYGKLVKKLTSRSALVGLPCQTISRGAYLKIGLFCGMCYSSRGLEYVFRRLGVKKEDIAFMEYRAPHTKHFVVRLRNGSKREISSPYWLSYFFPCKKCLYCTDYSNFHADISVGDIRHGWSVVLARTRRGKNIFETAIKEGYLRARTIKLQDYLKNRGSCLIQKEVRGGFVRTRLVATRGKWIECMPMYLLGVLGRIIAKVVKGNINEIFRDC